MKIYSIISRIEQELEESPRTKFAGANNRRIVEIDRLFDLLGDLKVTIPEDIRRATGILAEAENTIRDAQEQAQDLLADAQQEAEEILAQAQAGAEALYQQAQVDFENRVSEASVYKEAYERATEVTNEAENNANAIYNGARRYADEILSDLQRYMSEYHEMISANRKELTVTPDIPQPKAPVTEPQRDFDEPVVHLEQPTYQPRPAAPAPNYAPAPAYRPAAAPAYDDGYGDYDDGYESYPQQDRYARAPQPQYREDFPVEEDDYYDDDRYDDGDYDDRDYDDRDYDREDQEKPKKKGFFQRMFEIEEDDDDDYEDDWEDERPAKKAKGRKR